MRTDEIREYGFNLSGHGEVWTGRERRTEIFALDGANLEKVICDWLALLPTVNRRVGAASACWDAMLMEEALGVLSGKFPGETVGRIYVDTMDQGAKSPEGGIAEVRSCISVHWTVELLDSEDASICMQDCTADLDATYAPGGTVRAGEVCYEDGDLDGPQGSASFTVDGGSVTITDIDVRQGDRIRELISRRSR